jgi:hypothetical protein
MTQKEIRVGMNTHFTTRLVAAVRRAAEPGDRQKVTSENQSLLPNEAFT